MPPEVTKLTAAEKVAKKPMPPPAGCKHGQNGPLRLKESGPGPDHTPIANSRAVEPLNQGRVGAVLPLGSYRRNDWTMNLPSTP